MTIPSFNRVTARNTKRNLAACIYKSQQKRIVLWLFAKESHLGIEKGNILNVFTNIRNDNYVLPREFNVIVVVRYV